MRPKRSLKHFQGWVVRISGSQRLQVPHCRVPGIIVGFDLLPKLFLYMANDPCDAVYLRQRFIGTVYFCLCRLNV